MSVAENLTLVHPVTSRGVVRTRTRNRLAQEWIEKFDIRPSQSNSDITALSGGNQQKVVLAKWLCGDEVRVLVLDRPLRGLDAGAIEHVKASIRAAAAERAAVFMIADTLDEALDVADAITVMKDGVVTGRFDLSEHRPSVIELLEKMV
jgi:ribose transport system ATP-binding protein